MLVCACYVHSCTRDRGCSKHPACPAPSFFVGETICKARAECAAGMRRCGLWSLRETKNAAALRNLRWARALQGDDYGGASWRGWLLSLGGLLILCVRMVILSLG